MPSSGVRLLEHLLMRHFVADRRLIVARPGWFGLIMTLMAKIARAPREVPVGVYIGLD